MKIALIGQKGIPSQGGGVETYTEGLATRLVKAGHEVYVYTRPNYTDKKLKEYKGVKLISLPSIPSKNLDAISHTFLASLDLIFRRKVDVINFQAIGPSSLIWLVKLFKPNTPIVSSFRSRCYYHQKWGKLAQIYLKFGERMACNMADKVISSSKLLQRYAQKKYGSHAYYIPNGVKVNESSDIDLLEQWNLKPDDYLLAVSRLIRHKGIHYLIKAYNNLDTDKKLVIVGDGSYTDDYVRELKSLAKDNKNIIFTGRQTGENLNTLFANSYLIVHPSEAEGMSNVLLEAMAYGKGILASDIPENLEVLGGTGFVFTNKDVGDLNIKLKQLLNNSELVRERGKESRLRVSTEYSWERIVKEVIDVYQEAIQGSKFKYIRRKRKPFKINS